MKRLVLKLWNSVSFGPATRISFGLTSLVVSMLLVADLMFGLLPDPVAQLRVQRAHLAQSVATQVSLVMDEVNPQVLHRLLKSLVAREPGMVSVAVRRRDGRVLAQEGDHPGSWSQARELKPSLEFLQVPLDLNGQHWGGVELSFVKATPNGVLQWAQQPSVLIVLLLGVGSFVGFSLYLRRVLSHLDPSAVIPDRVRSAFDVFAGGVMVVDPSSRLMMTNAALRRWMGSAADTSLQGQIVDELDWFKAALPMERGDHPWVRAMNHAQSVDGELFVFRTPQGASLRTMVNSAPILDSLRKVRGALVTFENVTPLHDLNTQLIKSMTDLEFSRQEIQTKNDELQKLATRDPLTGAMNRRALFDKLDPLFAEYLQTGRPLCCIMTDIDHFKSFNDRHGHAVGDQVLQAVTRSLASALREVDLLCRYGGEEFCIVLPDVDEAHACAIAERLRIDVETRAGASIRSTAGLQVTSSFGVSTLRCGLDNAPELIDEADQALYQAKKAGRNRVVRFTPVP